MEKSWFVVHTHSGSEKKVKANIEERVKNMGMQDFIFEVIVPEEKAYEMKDGKRVEVIRKVYPGYLLVEMVMTDESWSVIRNTPGVTGFIGTGSAPTPLPEQNVMQIKRQMGFGEQVVETKFALKEGQKAKVIDGPFANFSGVIESINEEKRLVKVSLRIFGRETSVELDFNQVEEG